MPFLYEKKENCIEITGYEGKVRDLIIPESIEELPVKRIAGHAFDGRKDLESVFIPGSVEVIRSFAFYACINLKRIELSNLIVDYYDGVIRQCTGIERITMHMDNPGSYRLLKDMLADYDGTLRFLLKWEDHELSLTFPGYSYDAHEDTMARAIHFSIEGTGFSYRECVSRGAVDLMGYDRYFAGAIVNNPDAAADIALDRLTAEKKDQPAGKFRAQYEEYLKENCAVILKRQLETGNTERAMEMIGHGWIDDGKMQELLQLASDKGQMQITAMLMSHHAQNGDDGAVTPKASASMAMTLEDW